MGVRVFERPDQRDIASLLKQGSHVLRAIRDTRSGDLYVWDAESALHEQIIRQLGLSDFAENLGQIHSLADFERLSGKQ